MNKCEEEREKAWNSIPAFLRIKMDKATFDLAWALGWQAAKNEVADELKQTNLHEDE